MIPNRRLTKKARMKRFVLRTGLGIATLFGGAVFFKGISHFRNKGRPIAEYRQFLEQNPNVPSKRVKGIAEVAKRCNWGTEKVRDFNARLKMVNELARKRRDKKEITAKDFMFTLTHKQDVDIIRSIRDTLVSRNKNNEYSQRINQLNRVLDVLKYGEEFKRDALRYYYLERTQKESAE